MQINETSVLPPLSPHTSPKWYLSMFRVNPDLPLIVKDTLLVCDRFRSATLSKAFAQNLDSHSLSILSGHLEKSNHIHPYFNALYLENKGYIDHILVSQWIQSGDPQNLSRLGLSQLNLGPKGKPRLYLIDQGISMPYLDTYLGKHRDWQSITPYFPLWHLRKGYSVVDQVKKELLLRLDPLSVHLNFDSIQVQLLQPNPFTNWIAKRNGEFLGTNRPLPLGLRIRFDEPFSGPLRLGAGAHFGMGFFQEANAAGF